MIRTRYGDVPELPLTQPEIDQLNRERLEYAIKHNTIYQPYIPLMMFGVVDPHTFKPVTESSK